MLERNHQLRLENQNETMKIESREGKKVHKS